MWLPGSGDMYQDSESGSLGRVVKGSWSDEEDDLLRKCIQRYGEGNWKRVPERAGTSTHIVTFYLSKLKVLIVVVCEDIPYHRHLYKCYFFL